MYRTASFLTAALITAALFSACSSKTAIQLQGQIEGATPESTVILNRLNFSQETLIDTLEIKEGGSFTYTFEPAGPQPDYFYCYSDNVRVANLILKQGDKVSFTTSMSNPSQQKVEGSDETLLLQEATSKFAAATSTFDSLYALYEGATGDRQKELNQELGRVFVKYKQDAIRFMFTHPYSFANTTVTFQTFPGSLFVFSDSKDGPLLRRIYDSLLVAYPNSAYVEAVSERAKSLERSLMMEIALENVEVADFPDVCAPDMMAKNVCLSSLKGNTIVLSFWSSQNVDMRLENQELLECYDKYVDKGLVVYQVALDTDKSLWAAAVREQQLPWINVCDGLGVYSPSVTTYGITEVPAFFLIDKEGNLVAKGNTVESIEKTLKTLF